MAADDSKPERKSWPSFAVVNDVSDLDNYAADCLVVPKYGDLIWLVSLRPVNSRDERGILSLTAFIAVLK
jgi:hypothetical protein